MRHRKKGKKMGRTSSHRKRTLQALSNALIENKRITTTVAKAKALRPFVEPLITRAKKEDTQHNRRQVFRHLQSNDAIEELFGEVSERVGDRPGGYTRIIKLGQRSGDGAELALIELVDYNDVPPSDTGGGGSGGTRRGSGKGRRQSTEETQKPETTDASSDAEGGAEPESAESSVVEEEEPASEEASSGEEANDSADEAEK